jgi:hypothetical protein
MPSLNDIAIGILQIAKRYAPEIDIDDCSILDRKIRQHLQINGLDWYEFIDEINQKFSMEVYDFIPFNIEKYVSWTVKKERKAYSDFSIRYLSEIVFREVRKGDNSTSSQELR